MSFDSRCLYSVQMESDIVSYCYRTGCTDMALIGSQTHAGVVSALVQAFTPTNLTCSRHGPTFLALSQASLFGNDDSLQCDTNYIYLSNNINVKLYQLPVTQANLSSAQPNKGSKQSYVTSSREQRTCWEVVQLVGKVLPCLQKPVAAPCPEQNVYALFLYDTF